MRIGVVFPTMEIGNDPIAIRDFAQAAESMGYDHILFEEHVLGADPDRDGGWPYGPVAGRAGPTKDAPIHEPFVLCGFLAGQTERIELATAVLILPQRQTALVAKQVAELDLLSGGRFRLGVGVGWNPVEFEGLGADFSTRGRRQEEQIALLRELWQHEVVDFQGEWERVDRAGINPLPKRTIPIWLGGGTLAPLKRAARLADGYMPLGLQPGDAAKALKERLQAELAAAGRSDDDFGLQVFAGVRTGTPDEWSATFRAWEEFGASHLAVRVTGIGDSSVGAFIGKMREYQEAIGR